MINIDTQAADVYSYAFVLWEMVSRETPFKDIPHLEMAKLVVEDKQRPILPDNCPDSFKELVESCWHPIPSKRPAMSDVLVYLQNIKGAFTEVSLHHFQKANKLFVKHKRALTY